MTAVDEPINFREARANKQNNAKLWTPSDCFKAIVRDLESGELNPVDAVYVAMVRKDKDGQAIAFPFYTAGATNLELRGMLTQHLYETCKRFEQP